MIGALADGPGPIALRHGLARRRAGGLTLRDPREPAIVTVVFTLDRVVPWGRSFDEYVRMFALSEADLAGRVLGCADGPASFNVEATARGGQVVSCDPLYRWSTAGIRARVDETFDCVLAQTRQNADAFVWDTIPSVEALGRLRRSAMQEFLDDYEVGRAEGRYIDAALPALPFADAGFELALCSHFLFLYSGQFDEAFHRAALSELCRVSAEVRVFPLLALDGQRSPHLEGCVDTLRAAGHAVSIERVAYEFQRGGHDMLRIVSGRRSA
jgi:hypothetical protein